MTHTHNNLHAILWTLASCLGFSLMATGIRVVSQELHAFEIVFFRNFFAALILLPLFLKHGRSLLHSDHPKLHLGRATTGVIGMLFFFSGIALLPLPEAITLSFSVPIFTCIAAIIFLGETVGWHRWLAMCIGLGGVIITMRPGMETFRPESFLVIFATMMWAGSNILMKQMTKTERPLTMITILALLTTPLSLPFAISVWQWPDVESLCWLFGIAAISNLAQYSLTRALHIGDIAVVMPLDFSRLVFVSIFAWLLFDEIMDSWTALGACIIFASSFYIIRRESKLGKKPRVTDNAIE